MKINFVSIFLLIFCSLNAFSQEIRDSWSFKSPLDSYEVKSIEGRLFIGNTPVAQRTFEAFLKVLLRPNSDDCPTLGRPELTVIAKSRAITVEKKFFPKEGVIEASGKCAPLEFDTGWSLPFHREWFIGETSAKIDIGNSMSFKSKDLSFQIYKKDNSWYSSSKEFIPDLVRMANFAQAAAGFKVTNHYSKNVKESARAFFNLSTGGQNYRFYLISAQWCIEAPGKKWLVATRDFSMLGKFSKEELKDNKSGALAILADKNAELKQRMSALEGLSNTDSPVLKSIVQRLYKDDSEAPDLRHLAGLFLVDRPSVENVEALMSLLDRPQNVERALATKVMRKLNPSGPQISPDDQFANTDDQVQRWKQWHAKYLKVHQ